MFLTIEIFNHMVSIECFFWFPFATCIISDRFQLLWHWNFKAHTNFTVKIEKILSTIKESCSLFWFYLRGRSKNINKWTWMDPSYQFSFLMKMQGFTLSGGCIPLEHWIFRGLKKSAQSHFRNWFVILTLIH